MTTNGSVTVMTGTTFGVQAQVLVQSTASVNAAEPTNAPHLAWFGGAAIAVFGLMIAL